MVKQCISEPRKGLGPLPAFTRTWLCALFLMFLSVAFQHPTILVQLWLSQEVRARGKCSSPTAVPAVALSDLLNVLLMGGKPGTTPCRSLEKGKILQILFVLVLESTEFPPSFTPDATSLSQWGGSGNAQSYPIPLHTLPCWSTPARPPLGHRVFGTQNICLLFAGSLCLGGWGASCQGLRRLNAQNQMFLSCFDAVGLAGPWVLPEHLALAEEPPVPAVLAEEGWGQPCPCPCCRMSWASLSLLLPLLCSGWPPPTPSHWISVWPCPGRGWASPPAAPAQACTAPASQVLSPSMWEAVEFLLLQHQDLACSLSHLKNHSKNSGFYCSKEKLGKKVSVVWTR